MSQKNFFTLMKTCLLVFIPKGLLQGYRRLQYKLYLYRQQSKLGTQKISTYKTISVFYKNTNKAISSHKKIIFMIDGKFTHGGMADRLRGCLGVYCLCKKMNIPFFINWTYPFDLSLFLEPNNYNWEIDKKDIIYEYPYSTFLVYQAMDFLFESYLDKRTMIKDIKTTNSSQYHIYSNTIISKSNWSVLFNELFKPSEILQRAIDKNKRNLGEKYYCFTFRFQQLLGDFIEGDFKILGSQEKEELISRCLNELILLIDNVPQNYKILVTSDSKTFLDRVKLIPRVYVIPGNVAHMDYSEGSEIFLKSFVDFYMLLGGGGDMSYANWRYVQQWFSTLCRANCKQAIYSS